MKNKKDYKISKKQLMAIYWTSTVICILFLGFLVITSYVVTGLPDSNVFVQHVKNEKYFTPFFLTIGFSSLFISLMTQIPTIKALWANVAKLHKNGDITRAEFEQLETLVDSIIERMHKDDITKAKVLIEAYKEIEQKEKEIQSYEIELEQDILKQELEMVVNDDKERKESNY